MPQMCEIIGDLLVYRQFWNRTLPFRLYKTAALIKVACSSRARQSEKCIPPKQLYSIINITGLRKISQNKPAVFQGTCTLLCQIKKSGESL